MMRHKVTLQPRGRATWCSTLLATALSIYLAPSVFAAASDTDMGEKEALEVGGLLTIDAANRFKDWQNTPAELGSVELSAKVHVHENMEAAITLLSESNPEQISIDQAIGEWRLKHGRIVFGQQYFNLGLLSTRLITDPLILDYGEFSAAGLTGLMESGPLTLGGSITSLATGPDSALRHDPCFIVNADLTHNESLARLSSQLSKERIAIDGAANLILGSWFWMPKPFGEFAMKMASPKEGIMPVSLIHLLRPFSLVCDGMAWETNNQPSPINVWVAASLLP